MRHSLACTLLGFSLMLGPALAADLETRVIGGCESADSSHEWMVAVAKKNFSDEYNSQFCGATLIHESWAITAAHCMYYGQADTPYQPEDLELYIGTTVLDSGEGMHHSVSAIYVNAGYDASTSQNDIALLKIANPSSLTPARLATIKPGADYDALTVGWGLTTLETASEEVSPYPQSLHEVNVTTFDNANCYSDLLPSQICAGELAGGEDSCSGDSGGPLLLTSQGQDTLIGVVSYGYSCAQPDNLGVYTSVPSYLEWIETTTVNSTTGLSDVPRSTAVSENFSDFASACTTKTAETGSLVSTPSSSSGGAVGAWFLALGLIGFSRRYTRSNNNNTNTNTNI